jgi:hypothetical protein
MDDKLNRYLGNKSLEELGTLRGLVSSICRDYDNSLVNYATINDDRSFTKMTKEVEEMHERRNKLFGLLMSINKIIEEKLFKLYE